MAHQDLAQEMGGKRAGQRVDINFSQYVSYCFIPCGSEYEFKGFDAGPVFSVLGYNDVEGLRLRLGGRTYFGQNDMWRLEGFGAYGFKDEKFKYGLSGKVLLSKKNRKILFFSQ